MKTIADLVGDSNNLGFFDLDPTEQLHLARQDATAALGDSDQDQDLKPAPAPIENSGKAMREKEHCILVRLLDFSQLKKANRAEIQEQWGVKIERTENNAGAGHLRVRAITGANGETRYEMTTKSLVDEGKIEVTVPTTKENFIQFKVMAESGMIKHRYTFENEDGSKWEVDCTPDGNGGYFPWARCEIEVSDLDAEIPNLPIKVEESIMPPKLGSLSQEDYDAKTKPLYDRFFVRANAYVEEGSVSTPLEQPEPPTDDQSKEEFNEGAKDEDQETMTKKEADEQNMSIENVTDDPKKAQAVEDKAEQIMEARGKSLDDGEEDETTDDTEGSDDNNAEGDDSGEETEGEEGNEDGTNSDAGDSDEGDAGEDGDTEDTDGELTKQSFRDSVEFVNALFSRQAVEGDVALTVNPEEVNNTQAAEDINAIQLAMATIRSSQTTDEEKAAARQQVRRIYSRVCSAEDGNISQDDNDIPMAKNAILAHYSRVFDVNDVDVDMSEESLISHLQQQLYN